jgi:hypothetical protein
MTGPRGTTVLLTRDPGTIYCVEHAALQAGTSVTIESEATAEMWRDASAVLVGCDMAGEVDLSVMPAATRVVLIVAIDNVDDLQALPRMSAQLAKQDGRGAFTTVPAGVPMLARLLTRFAEAA